MPYELYKRFATRANDVERCGFRAISITTVTTWSVYPLGYLLTFTSIDLNYVHITSVFDIFNEVGVSLIAYLVSELLDNRLEEKKILAGYTVG